MKEQDNLKKEIRKYSEYKARKAYRSYQIGELRDMIIGAEDRKLKAIEGRDVEGYSAIVKEADTLPGELADLIAQDDADTMTDEALVKAWGSYVQAYQGEMKNLAEEADKARAAYREKVIALLEYQREAILQMEAVKRFAAVGPLPLTDKEKARNDLKALEKVGAIKTEKAGYNRVIEGEAVADVRADGLAVLQMVDAVFNNPASNGRGGIIYGGSSLL